MVLLGLVLIAAAAVAGTRLYMASMNVPADQTTQLEAWGLSIGFKPLVLILAGLAVAVALLLGLALMRSGFARNARKRKERKELERNAEVNRVAAEQANARRLDEERNSRIGTAENTRGVDDRGVDRRGVDHRGPFETRDNTPPPPPRP